MPANLQDARTTGHGIIDAAVHHRAVADLISASRLAPYLAGASGDLVSALRLYRWNIAMSAAAYEMLHVVEVVLRNTIDRQVRTWNARQTDPSTGRPHAAEWSLDPSRLVRRLAGQDLERARRRAHTAVALSSTGARAMTHDDVIAQLSMGTWRYLLPDRDPGRRRLWADSVHAGFPHLTRAERDLVADIDGLYRLRNRVAHLEPLLNVGLIVPQLAAARRTLRDVDPSAEQWLLSHQSVTRVARQRPSPPEYTNGPLSQN